MHWTEYKHSIHSILGMVYQKTRDVGILSNRLLDSALVPRVGHIFWALHGLLILALIPWMGLYLFGSGPATHSWYIPLSYITLMLVGWAYARIDTYRFAAISWPLIALDACMIGWLVYATGGIDSNFYLLFFALVPFVSFYRGLKIGLWMVLATIAGYFVICVWGGGLKILPDFAFRAVMLCIFTVGMGYSSRYIKQAETRLLKALDKLNERTSELEKTHAHLQTIYETSRSLAELMKVEDVVNRLLLIAQSVLDYPVCEIYTWNQTTETLWLNGRVDHLHTTRLDKPQRIELTDFLRPVVKDGSVGRITDRHEGRSIFDGNPNRSRLVVPMVCEGKIVGVLSAESPKPSAFNEHDERVLSILAASTAMSLVNADLHQRMEKLTIIDELTGVYNYRHFRARLEEERRRTVRYGQPLSLVMVDIDWFKRLNDRYGHETGNIALQRLAEVILSCTRDVDMVARYGGEEFSVILPQTTASEARVIGERIRRTVEHTEFGRAPNGEPIRLTVSIGISCYPDNGRPEDELVETADKALYDAKGKGRNLVCTT